MDFSSLPLHLQKTAEIANAVIKQRYNLPNGSLSTAINTEIPITPTLHWRTPKEFIVCEVADRPYPTIVKLQYTDIAATGLPVRIIVAYPHDHGLPGSEFNRDQKTLKALGIGFLSANDLSTTNSIEYQGVCVNQKIDQVEFKRFPKKILREMQEAFESYMVDGKPNVGLQQLGQVAESLIYNAAVDAKKKGLFPFSGFNPPLYLAHAQLIAQLKLAAVLNLGLLDRCKDFAKQRNAVSHTPKTIKEATKIFKEIRDNFILGLKLVEDISIELKSKNLIIKV